MNKENIGVVSVIEKKKTLKDALVLASANPTFKMQLALNPEQLKDEYNITDEQIAQIRAVSCAAPGDLHRMELDEAEMLAANYENGGNGGRGSGGRAGGKGGAGGGKDNENKGGLG